MKSRTSFFNTTVLRKDITRFAPVWALYAAGLVIYLLFPTLIFDTAERAEWLLMSMMSLPTITMILGGVSALMVFGDLFKARLCYATHALPLRREGWFLTHYTAGALFGIVPNIFISLLFLLLLGEYRVLAPLWLVASILQYLFFFSVGAFSAACAGNRLGTVAIYLTLNLGVGLIGSYAEGVFVPMLHGLEFQWDFLDLVMPVSHIPGLELVALTADPLPVIDLIPGDWLYLGIMAVIGLVFAFLAVLVYRKRNLETAGDFLSLPAAKPVFLIIYSLLIGIAIHAILPYVGLFLGLFIGVFTGKMLLERTVRVFKGKNFLFFGVVSTVMTIALVLTLADIAGLTRYVPDTKDVKSLTFYENVDRYQDNNWSTTDPAKIDQFREFHTEMTDGTYKDTKETTVTVYLQYELKNGRTVIRKYTVPVASEHGQFVRRQLSSWQYVFTNNDWEECISRAEKLEIELEKSEENVQLSLTEPEQIRGLLEAVKADCEAGNMAQNWNYHSDEDTAAWLYMYDADYYDNTDMDDSIPRTHTVYYVNLRIYDCCQYTIAYLESLGYEPVPSGK